MNKLVSVGSFCPNEASRITVKRSAGISFAMAKQAKDDNGFNVKHASTRATNAKARCSITAKRMKKIFWNV